MWKQIQIALLGVVDVSHPAKDVKEPLQQRLKSDVVHLIVEKVGAEKDRNWCQRMNLKRRISVIFYMFAALSIPSKMAVPVGWKINL